MAQPLRFTLAGRPRVVGATVIPREVELRFLARLPRDADPDACWPLQRCISTPPVPGLLPDYSVLRWWAGGVRHSIQAHRYALLREHGYLPTDRLALHRCNNKTCVNHGHLYAGTHAENEADKLRDPVVVMRQWERWKRRSPKARERARARMTALGLVCEAA